MHIQVQKIKIQKTEIGALPIIISIKGDCKIFSSKNFSKLLKMIFMEAAASASELFKIKTSIKNTNLNMLYGLLLEQTFYLKVSIIRDEEYEFIKFNLHDVVKKYIMFSYKNRLSKKSSEENCSHNK